VGDPIPQSAYDSAAAVFSRSFRFVEWKYVIPAKKLSAPLGDRGAPPHKAVKKIDRRKWIYVFRHDDGAEYAAVLEEIRVDDNGQMYATERDRLEKPIKSRGNPVALGTTMSLPRRLFGVPKVYRFYASRVRLPLAQIKELEKTVHTFAPRTILDQADNTSVIVQNGELLVPVVDPITVALHLHAAYVAAADDLINYTTAHAGLGAATRKTVGLRRKKHLLGTLLKAIIGEEKNVNANNLVHELKGLQGPLEEFLFHYDKHLEWRVGRRDRLAGYLVQWLTSDAMKIAAAAHKTFGKDIWVQFFVPWCHIITRLFESPTGRQHLAALLDDKDHFVHKFVWPQQPLSDDAVQAVRKGGMTVFEAWAGLVETRVFIKGTNFVPEIVESLRNLRQLAKAQTLTTTSLKRINTLNRSITAVQLIDPGPVKEVRPFATGAKTMSGLIESVNLVLAVKAFDEAMKGDDPKARELAILNLVGSTLDASSAIASLLKKGEKVVAVFGFVSGVIDVYLGVDAMNKAFKDGDQDIANGSFLTAAGATIGTAGSILALGAVPGAQAVLVIGLAVVAIGMIYKWLKGKEPLERFFLHCSWGKSHDLIRAGKLKGGADWSPTRFEQWKGDNEFDYQLEALLNIICKVEISHGDTYRDLRFKAGWLPPDARLLIVYQEQWKSPDQPFTVESEILVQHTGLMSKDPRLVVTPAGQSGMKVTVVSGVPSTSPNQTVRFGGQRLPHTSLKKASASARLLVALDGATPVKVPHDKPAKNNFYD
jgi:hypothetical protein